MELQPGRSILVLLCAGGFDGQPVLVGAGDTLYFVNTAGQTLFAFTP